MFLGQFCLVSEPPSPCSDQAQSGSPAELARRFLARLSLPARLCDSPSSLPPFGGAGLPRQNKALPYLFLQQPLAASCPFPSQWTRHPNLFSCSRRKQRRSNTNTHVVMWQRHLSFISITCRLPAPRKSLVWEVLLSAVIQKPPVHKQKWALKFQLALAILVWKLYGKH